MSLLPTLLFGRFEDTRFIPSHRTPSTRASLLQPQIEASKAPETLFYQTSNAKSCELHTETAAVGQDEGETPLHQQSGQDLPAQGLNEGLDTTPGKDELNDIGKNERDIVSEIFIVKKAFMSEICKLREENARQIGILNYSIAIEIGNLKNEIIREIDNVRQTIVKIYLFCVVVAGTVFFVCLHGIFHQWC